MQKTIAMTLSLVVFAAAGCGGETIERVAIDAAVSYNGVPVDKGRVTFKPVAGTESPQATGLVINGKMIIAQERGPGPGTFEAQLVVKDEDAPPAVEQEGGKSAMPQMQPKVGKNKKMPGQTKVTKVKVTIESPGPAILDLIFL